MQKVEPNSIEVEPNSIEAVVLFILYICLQDGKISGKLAKEIFSKMFDPKKKIKKTVRIFFRNQFSP